MKNTVLSPKLPIKRTPRPAVVPPDRGVAPERTFVNGGHSSDPLAEEMGEEAVRAMTSGEDETVAQQRDGLAPNLNVQIDEAIELEETDFEEMVTGEFSRADRPNRV